MGETPYKVGDRVEDGTEDNLGEGEIVDVYRNYHDDPMGQVVLTVEFEPFADPEAEDGVDPVESTVCDRLPHQVRPAVTNTPTFPRMR